MDFLNGVSGQTLICTVPDTCSLQTEFGVVDFVVDGLFETIVSAVHPCDVGVALHVNTNCGVERVCVIDGNTRVVHDNQVAFRTKSGVFSIAVLHDGVSCAAWDPCWVVVHLAIGVQDGHVNFTRVVGGNVDHCFHKKRHCVCTAGPRWEFVCLASSVRGAEGVTRTVSSLGRDHAVRALNEIHKVGLDVTGAAVALAVQANWDNTCCEAVVVGFLNRSQVICLLGWIAVFWPFI